MAHQSVEHAGTPVPEGAPTPRVAVETNGANVIAENERRGTPRQLFWPWFGANVSVFGLAYGSFLLGFGISFWQAIVAGVVGIVVFPALRLRRHRRQAWLGPDPGAEPGGVRRQRQPGAQRPVLGAHRRLGDGPGLPRDAGHRTALRPARVERRD